VRSEVVCGVCGGKSKKHLKEKVAAGNQKEGRIISSLAGFVRTAGANSILHSARMILSDVLTCTVPPLRVESSLLKNPIPPEKKEEDTRLSEIFKLSDFHQLRWR
jgi:hypothetical protein